MKAVGSLAFFSLLCAPLLGFAQPAATQPTAAATQPAAFGTQPTAFGTQSAAASTQPVGDMYDVMQRRVAEASADRIDYLELEKRFFAIAREYGISGNLILDAQHDGQSVDERKALKLMAKQLFESHDSALDTATKYNSLRNKIQFGTVEIPKLLAEGIDSKDELVAEYLRVNKMRQEAFAAFTQEVNDLREQLDHLPAALQPVLQGQIFRANRQYGMRDASRASRMSAIKSLVEIP